VRLSKSQSHIPRARDMALEDAWLFLKDEEHTRGQKSFIDRATKNLHGQNRLIGEDGSPIGLEGRQFLHSLIGHAADNNRKFYQVKADAQKKVSDMLSKDFGAVDWKHNGLSGNHHDVHHHMEDAMMRAQMRMHAIDANNLDHPCLHSDDWFYRPKHFNSPRTHGFDSATGGLFDKGLDLAEIYHGMSLSDMSQSFNPGGEHHQENMPAGLGAERTPVVGAHEDYPEHSVNYTQHSPQQNQFSPFETPRDS